VFCRDRRGEKLYVTKDKREKKSCKKPICWGMTLTILAAAIFIVVLISSKHRPFPPHKIVYIIELARWAL
jgi:hypothetical protein